jgi:FeS assembly SUF system protein
MDNTVKPSESNTFKADSEVQSAESPVTPSASAHSSDLEARIVDVLRTVYDPEIPVNIYEIGLIYNVDIDASNAVHVRMTLTSPACPVAGTLPGEVEEKIRRVEGVTDAKVEIVWDPAWTPAMMSESAKLQLGMF